MTEQTNTPTTATGATAATASARGLRKERVGQVVSTKMQKTAIVETTTRVPHAKFGKIVKQVKRFYAHDEERKAQLGDTVRIAETRPLSKLKRWRLVEIIKH
jgi:small subunit ribosomal protein S17